MRNNLQLYKKHIIICGRKQKLDRNNSFECELLLALLITEQYRAEIINFDPSVLLKSKKFFVKLDRKEGFVKMKILNENNLLLVSFKALDNWADALTFYKIVGAVAVLAVLALSALNLI